MAMRSARLTGHKDALVEVQAVELAGWFSNEADKIQLDYMY